MPCDSGVKLPDDGRLTDGVNDYCVMHCGYVVSYARGWWFNTGRPVADAHLQQHHPQAWAETKLARDMTENER